MATSVGRCASRRSAALRAEPVALSQAKPTAAIAGRVLEHYSDIPLNKIYSRQQETLDEEKDWHWRGKPRGLWVSVKGEDDWPDWCNSESFGLERLGICHRIELVPNANVLWVEGELELVDFSDEYGHKCKLTERSTYSRWLIDWNRVAAKYDGIIIAPYVWKRRLDGRESDWYYSWDCASGCIWNADIIASALAAATGTAKTPTAAECGASQSGPKGNAQGRPLP